MKTFPVLFKKYRLKAEFETFAEFGEALEKKGYYYDESMFSRWQSGRRHPSGRQLLLAILEIFVERKAVLSLKEANELLESVGLGYLTEKEIASFPSLRQSIFQLPHEIADFAGRDDMLAFFKKESIQGKTILIYGPAGVGKTTLAIKVGHLLRQQFPDGVLWYRMDISKMKDVLIAIGHGLGEDLPKSNDIQVIASCIRSLLTHKKVFLLFDNVEKGSDLHLLLPHGSSSSLIILSRQKDIYLPTEITPIPLRSFSQKESLTLFENVLGRNYVNKHKKDLLGLSHAVGDLPLPVHIFAKQLQQTKMSAKELFSLVQKEELSLRNLSYENKNLYLALNISYKNLSEQARALFLSLGVFEGKDFSSDAIAYMNGLSVHKTRDILEELHSASLIETSIKNKFRIHPMVKRFIGEKLRNPYLSMLMKVTILLFVGFTIYWIILQLSVASASQAYFSRVFSATYFIVALFGGIWGVYISQKWGGFKSVMGKAILFFALGLFAQSLGQILYISYDILFHIQAPYPSLGDIGYFGTIPLYMYGMILFAKTSEAKITVHNIKENMKIFMSSVIALILTYIFILQVYTFDWSNLLKVFLDFAYPLGDMVYAYFAYLTYAQLKQKKSSRMKGKVLLIFVALIMQYLSDCGFIYQKSTQTWHFGSLNEYMYFFSYLLMTLSIIRLNSGMAKVITK